MLLIFHCFWRKNKVCIKRNEACLRFENKRYHEFDTNHEMLEVKVKIHQQDKINAVLASLRLMCFCCYFDFGGFRKPITTHLYEAEFVSYSRPKFTFWAEKAKNGWQRNWDTLYVCIFLYICMYVFKYPDIWHTFQDAILNWSILLFQPNNFFSDFTNLQRRKKIIESFQKFRLGNRYNYGRSTNPPLTYPPQK